MPSVSYPRSSVIPTANSREGGTTTKKKDKSHKKGKSKETKEAQKSESISANKFEEISSCKLPDSAALVKTTSGQVDSNLKSKANNIETSKASTTGLIVNSDQNQSTTHPTQEDNKALKVLITNINNFLLITNALYIRKPL